MQFVRCPPNFLALVLASGGQGVIHFLNLKTVEPGEINYESRVVIQKATAQRTSSQVQYCTVRTS